MVQYVLRGVAYSALLSPALSKDLKSLSKATSIARRFFKFGRWVKHFEDLEEAHEQKDLIMRGLLYFRTATGLQMNSLTQLTHTRTGACPSRRRRPIGRPSRLPRSQGAPSHTGAPPRPRSSLGRAGGTEYEALSSPATHRRAPCTVRSLRCFHECRHRGQLRRGLGGGRLLTRARGHPTLAQARHALARVPALRRVLPGNPILTPT